MNLQELLEEHPLLEADLFHQVRVVCGNEIEVLGQCLHDMEGQIISADHDHAEALAPERLQTQVQANPFWTGDCWQVVCLLVLRSAPEGYLTIRFNADEAQARFASHTINYMVDHRIRQMEQEGVLRETQIRLSHSQNQLNGLQKNFDEMSTQNLAKHQEFEKLVAQKTELLNQALQKARMLDLLQDVNYRSETEFLARCCLIVGEFIHAANVLIWLIDKEHNKLILITNEGVLAELDFSEDLLSGLVGRCFLLRESSYSNQPTLMELIPQALQKVATFPKIHNVLVSPIEFRREAIGVLQVLNKDGAFTDEDLLDSQDIAKSLTSHLNIHKLIFAQISAKNELESLLETIPDVVYKIDTEGKFLYLSPAIESFGYKVSELIGTNFQDFIIADRNRILTRKMMSEVAKAGDSHAIFDERRSGSRATKGLEVQIKPGPLRGEGNVYGEVSASGYWQGTDPGKRSFRGSIGIIRDITLRRQAESNLQKVQEDKARLEAQLLQLQKMEVIGTLAGGIAHDFNNILQPILGYTYLLMQSQAQNHEVSMHLNNIWTAANRARDLVKQILTLSRQAEFQKRPFDLNPLIQEVVQLIQGSSPPDITFRVNLPKKPLLIFGDPGQIHQVLMNFCTNACYAMRDKGGVLEIHTEVVIVGPDQIKGLKSLQPAHHVKLSIKDQGIGMDKPTLERIFEPFFTTKKPGEGTGLGLSVVHGIVSSHDGAVIVDSRVNRGTTFTVYLPLHNEAEAVATKEMIPVESQKERILFVDDEEIITQLGKDILERLGYQVDITCDSMLALEMVGQKTYDLVITDNYMPKMSGIALVESIRAKCPDLPVILTTGNDTRGTTDRLKEFKHTAYLFKPVSPEEMHHTIRNLLRQAKEGIAPSQG